MIKLIEEQKLRRKEAPLILVRIHCMICLAFPEVIVHKENTAIWKQRPNPQLSNRVCLHIKHDLEFPHCESGIEPREVIDERYHIESNFREEILKRDNYTCQACGYKQTQKTDGAKRQAKGEPDAEYLHRRFLSSLAHYGKPKSLVVAHYNKRYGKETYDSRHKVENARTLCTDCHNMETTKHQMER